MAERDKKHFFHPFTSLKEHQEGTPHCMQRAEGITIHDSQGRAFIDAMAGLWCVNVGYGREEIAQAIYGASRKLSYYHSFMSIMNEPAVLLSERLASLAPGDLNKVFFCNSGSEANDTHVKLVRYYNNLRGKPAKKKFISRTDAYHGVTLAAASLSGLPALHNAFDLPLDGFLHVGRPSHYWDAPEGMSEAAFSQHLADELEQRLGIAFGELLEDLVRRNRRWA